MKRRPLELELHTGIIGLFSRFHGKTPLGLEGLRSGAAGFHRPYQNGRKMKKADCTIEDWDKDGQRGGIFQKPLSEEVGAVLRQSPFCAQINSVIWGVDPRNRS